MSLGGEKLKWFIKIVSMWFLKVKLNLLVVEEAVLFFFLFWLDPVNLVGKSLVFVLFF